VLRKRNEAGKPSQNQFQRTPMYQDDREADQP